MDTAKFNQILSQLHEFYYESISEMASDLREAVEKGEINDVDDAERWLDESIGSDQWYFMTGPSIAVQLVSDNDLQEYQSEFGELPDPRDSMFWGKLAAFAIDRDVREELGDLDELFEEEDDEEDED